MRLRLYNQRSAIWEEKWDAAHWIRTGQIRERTADRPRLEDDPAVLVAREQIRRDGGILIVENVTKAIDDWRRNCDSPAAQFVTPPAALV